MKVKKLIALILATITAACVAVGFSGCKEEIELPPMTESAPEVKITFSEMECYPIPKAFGPQGDYCEYNRFMLYYNGTYEQFGSFRQVCDKKFYFINAALIEPEVQGRFNMGAGIAILVKKGSSTENGLVNPVITCEGAVTDNDIGIYRKKGPNSPHTMEFEAYFLPVKDGVEDTQLILKFGKLSGTHYYNYYINLYKGESCIGTVYFHTEVSIPQDWFEGLFTRHLVYGG